MKTILSNCCILLLILFINGIASSQTVYVDAIHGKSSGLGTQANPVQTLYQAIACVKRASSKEPVVIRLMPGKYLLTEAFHIDSLQDTRDGSVFTIEASVMPASKGWQLSDMPIIECNADSNRLGRLPHASAGFDIRRGNVLIKGLRFTGNTHPSSLYYYAIERKNPLLEKLILYRCLFEGNKTAAPIQGAVFSQGPGLQVDHCTFQSCKNAVMTFVNCRDFSLTYSVINDAYEGAVWHGYDKDSDLPFEFSYNIIRNSRYIWIGSGTLHNHYTFKNSIVTNNTYWLGINGNTIEPDTKNKPLLLDTLTKDTIPAGFDQP